ncbi:MAG TPA: 7-carboxy-7-deazaguanine synthase QueE [Candidatus Acidoferrales bacterium]|nr:7-carboxy-7-deazaguanine synthase QueE [Candidatus Acidoferrales bacterium]
MKIAELFYSIQGEGSLAGVPSVFIRTSGCNLRCGWCDTPYTSWLPEGTELTLDQILDEVKAHPARHVVVTGGEPMIAPEIIPLTERLHGLGLHITIETAGTVFHPVACHLMSISPKLSNSTPDDPRWAAQHDRLRIQPAMLAQLMARYDYQLKFVIEKPDDLAEVRCLVADLKADRGRVILMPEGIDRERLRQRAIWLAEICKEEGFRFSPRLHVDLYGNRRGV